ncbi:MAG: response regulator [Bacteroidota bacterium]|jgi:DNA-binding NtrC family response regulator|nr:response regulator [Bacteroidota bacterium]MDP4190831.1 response regulator [Bacteroidota bacterium]MDP4194998.1 response regulator [Bacteroidota bacterium]
MESILIVDDDVNLCTVLREELTEIGYNANSVNSADEAFEFLSSGRQVDLILLDLKMPVRDGFYVLETLRAKKMNIKVIVLTAYADVKSAIDSAKMGASDFISKPYDFDELLITIRKVLQKEIEHED